MTRRALILDSEVSDFGTHPPHGAVTCAADVVKTLLGRHQDLIRRVGSLWLGTARPGSSDQRESGIGISVGTSAGLPGIPAYDVHAYCASGNVAVYRAIKDVLSGDVDVSLAVGVEHMKQYGTSGPLVPEAIPKWAVDFSPATYYGLCADAYMEKYGVKPEALAEVSVRNRAAAAVNPKAAMGGHVSVDDVLSSRMISTPLTLYQCCASVDGSGAALVVAEDVIEELGSPAGAVSVEGLGFATNTKPELADLTTFSEDVRSSSEAYEEAGIGPEELDIVEVHDAFSIAQVIHLEDLGIADPGAGAWVGTNPDDPRVNPSGGLIGRGHPMGATGLAQFDAVRRDLVSHGGGLGLVHEAGGLHLLSQMLSVSAVLAYNGQETN